MVLFFNRYIIVYTIEFLHVNGEIICLNPNIFQNDTCEKKNEIKIFILQKDILLTFKLKTHYTKFFFSQ